MGIKVEFEGEDVWLTLDDEHGKSIAHRLTKPEARVVAAKLTAYDPEDTRPDLTPLPGGADYWRQD